MLAQYTLCNGKCDRQQAIQKAMRKIQLEVFNAAKQLMP
jgi:hypothetical protein